MAIKSFSLSSALYRVAAIAVIVIVIFAVYISLRWSIGSTIAKQTESKDVAEFAVEMAPNDPQGYYSLAVVNEKNFLPESFTLALQNYEKAVSVSPHDFRLWLALGKAREQSGDSDGAEKAFRRSLQLAPNYADVHWILGNFLLRQGNDEEAFLEMRKAVEQDEKYSNPVVVTVWQIFGGDIAQISQKIGDSPAIRASLAPFLVKQTV